MSCRPLLSCLSRVYNFGLKQEQDMARAVPEAVLDELCLGLAMMPSAVADLTRPWAPFIMASDASPDFGFGICRAPCSPGIVREAADAAHLPQHEICPQMMEGDPTPREEGCFSIGCLSALKDSRCCEA